jgi:hypothetical protein
MAHRANFRVNFLSRAAGLECIPTAAMDYDLIVFWMYPFFHNNNTLKFPNPKLYRYLQAFQYNFFAII